MTVSVSSTSSLNNSPTMKELETLEAKMANIEVSLSTNGRRRKGGSIAGSVSSRSSSRPDGVQSVKEVRSALQDREAVIQSLRIQLGLGKLPRMSGTPLDEDERPAAEKRLTRLKIDAENKRIAIRNLKTAIDKLEMSDNIDVRIRQAELEYALGREELQLLSIVEEARALQARIEKSKPESHTLFNSIQSGVSLSLHAVQVTVGRWSVSEKTDGNGLSVEWALEGENLYRGDRIIEVNGKIFSGTTREELQQQLGSSSKCQLVVVRKRTMPFTQQQLVQTQEDNQRLQHRISYLEDQVKELQTARPEPNGNTIKNSSHITSINISSPPSTPPEKPQIYQRGNFVMAVIDGKPADQNNETMKSHVTRTIIKESQMNGYGSRSDTEGNNNLNNSKMLSASKVSLSSDIAHALQRRDNERRQVERDHKHYHGSYSQINQHCNRHRTSHNQARSVEHLNYTILDKRKEPSLSYERLRKNHIQTTTDLRSVKSLDSENESRRDVDYTSEPVAANKRPLPPKKPLRLSLQRAKSLQTVEASFIELEKKRAAKRNHRGHRTLEAQIIENSLPLQTASLGRNTHV